MSKKEETALATYGEWSPEQMEKEAKEMNTGGEFWKVPTGKTSVRFLPPKLGWPSPFVIQHQHFINMPRVEHPIIFCCPRMHEKKKCLSCMQADALETSGSARDEKLARKLRPSKRVVSNVIVDVKNEMAKPVVWTFGTQIYLQLKSIREDAEGGGNFLDPIKGFNIVVQRVGTGKEDTKYTLLASRTMTPLLNMEWIEMQVDPRRQVRIPTEAMQKRLLDGEDAKEVWGDRKKALESEESEALDNAIDVPGSSDKRTAEDDMFDNEVDLD